MEVNLEKRYPLDVDAARAWAVLRDVKSTAGCMPGANITEQIDDTHYKGTVKVKVGPANAAFAGDIEVQGLDDDGRRLQLMAKGAAATKEELEEADRTVPLALRARHRVADRLVFSKIRKRLGGRLRTPISGG